MLVKGRGKGDEMTTQPTHTPRRGRIAEMEQERIEQDVIDGERRYYQSVMADELSNDPEVFEEDFNG